MVIDITVIKYILPPWALKKSSSQSDSKCVAGSNHVSSLISTSPIKKMHNGWLENIFFYLFKINQLIKCRLYQM